MPDKKKILIVDDDPNVHVILKLTLEKAGYQTASAMDAMQGPMMARTFKPDLIILDIMMPMLDGNKKAKILKENQLCKNIPILLLSSKNEDEMNRLTLEAGADGYIRKPFTPSEIVAKVKQTLAVKHP